MADAESAPSELAAARPKVYVDTSVPSCLTSRPARAMPLCRRQRVSCLWWNAHGSRFERYASARVLSEAARGDSEAVRRRVEVISTLPLLEIGAAVPPLTELIMRHSRLPSCADTDAEHIAIAATHGIEYLVTWNCKHLANPEFTPKVADACERAGFRCPLICTPEAIIRRVVYGQPHERARFSDAR